MEKKVSDLKPDDKVVVADKKKDKIEARLQELERQLGIGPTKVVGKSTLRQMPIKITVSVPDYKKNRLFKVEEADTGRVIYRADVDANGSINFTLNGFVE